MVACMGVGVGDRGRLDWTGFLGPNCFMRLNSTLHWTKSTRTNHQSSITNHHQSPITNHESRISITNLPPRRAPAPSPFHARIRSPRERLLCGPWGPSCPRPCRPCPPPRPPWTSWPAARLPSPLSLGLSRRQSLPCPFLLFSGGSRV